MPRVNLRYYALLREQAGRRRRPSTRRPRRPRRSMRSSRRATFPCRPRSCGSRVNAAFCDWQRPIADGDEIVFIPPVAGG